MMKQWGYEELIDYMGMRKLPKGLAEAYELYQPEEKQELLPHETYETLLAPYDLSPEQKDFLDETLAAVEQDERVLFFSNFFVWDMCSMRNKYDIDNYTELVPECLGNHKQAYAFLILLACVPVSEKEMIRRGIPKEYYEDIPHRMLRDQLTRYKETGRIDVEDMPWKMNFYTLTIFLLDRFLFIPYQHGERFRLYRSRITGRVVGLCETGCTYDKEGQLLSWGFPEDEEEEQEAEAPLSETDNETKQKTNGKYNGYYYSSRKARIPGTFTTTFTEDDKTVTGYYMNPVGCTEERTVTLQKSEYVQVLAPGDWMIALHIPGGEGYTPERMKNSMQLAMDFFAKYYPELPMKGFWSSSWLYDERLRLMLSDDRNIPRVQNLMFRYSDGEDGSMLYVHLFKNLNNALEDCTCETSLQKKAKDMLQRGVRFCTSGMMILMEEAKTGKPYYTPEDKAYWKEASKIWGPQSGEDR
ncbi:MAG: acyltransferase domain-containing protein [Lachnospiraceae bacterium]|nr:acyltransferase domain-containing protein [Lachnospiraceae bacterium]